jgi:hypothetical protein
VAPLGFVVVGFQKPSPPPEATVLIPEKAIFKYDAGDVAVPSQGPTPRVVHDDNLFGGFTVQSPQFVLIPAPFLIGVFTVAIDSARELPTAAALG